MDMIMWRCSCGSGGMGGPAALEYLKSERDKHVALCPDHWPVRASAWEAQPCGHCPCFDGERPSDTECCRCYERYGDCLPLLEIGGRRFAFKDLVAYVRVLSADDEEQLP